MPEIHHNGLKEALKERGHSDKAISEMSAEEMFDEYCEWNGLINWGGPLRNVWAEARMFKFQQVVEQRVKDNSKGGLSDRPNLTCHGKIAHGLYCRKQYPFDYQGKCTACGAPNEKIYL